MFKFHLNLVDAVAELCTGPRRRARWLIIVLIQNEPGVDYWLGLIIDHYSIPARDNIVNIQLMFQ